MKKTSSISRVVLCVLFAVTVASACGDKVLRFNRIRRQGTKADHTTVLVYSRANSLLEKAADWHLEKAFRDEGYTLTITSSESDVAQALELGTVNAVIVDIADAGSVSRMTSKLPILTIPVVAKGDKQGELAARQYAAHVKSPAGHGAFLDAVDDAFDSKLARQNAKLQPMGASL